MSKRTLKNHNKNKKHFILFVKTVDDDGFVIEDKCGWLELNPKTKLNIASTKNAFIFEEKEPGHGSYEDWKHLFEDEHPNWRINPPKYID